MLQSYNPIHTHPGAAVSYPFQTVYCRPKNARRVARHVLLVSRGILLEDVLSGLLRDQPDFQLSVTRIDREETVAQTVVSTQAEVVVVCGLMGFSADLLSQKLLALNYTPAVQIIVIGLNENSFEVNSPHRHIYTNFRNFVDLIKSNALGIE